MAQTRIKEKAWAPVRIPEPAARPERMGEAAAVRECVSCYRIGIPDSRVSGGYAWMCRSVVGAWQGPAAGNAAPDLCPICVDALS